MWLVGILPQQTCTLNLINLMKKITDDNTWVPFGLPLGTLLELLDYLEGSTGWTKWVAEKGSESLCPV